MSRIRKIIAVAVLAGAVTIGWAAGHHGPQAELHSLMGACVHGQSIGIDQGAYRCVRQP